MSMKEIPIAACKACYNYLFNTRLLTAIDEYQKKEFTKQI